MMSSLTEFEGKKKKKKTPPTKASPWRNGLREKKRDWTYLIVFSVAQGGWEREASWGIFGGFSEYAEALGNSQLGKFSLFISQSLNFFFFLPNYWVKDLFLWLEVWFFIQIQLGMTLFRFFFFFFLN